MRNCTSMGLNTYIVMATLIFDDLIHSDKLGELERDKLRLAEQVQSQQRQVLEIEIEKLKHQQ